MSTFIDVAIITVVFGFFILSAVDLALRLVDSAKPQLKAHAEATVSKPKPQPIAKPQPKPQPKFESVGSAAVDYNSMSVRELRALCQADPIKFKGYSPYVKRGKVALIRFMQSR